MHYAISMTGTLTEHRSSLDPMHFQIYALLQYALLQFQLYIHQPRESAWYIYNYSFFERNRGMPAVTDNL